MLNILLETMIIPIIHSLTTLIELAVYCIVHGLKRNILFKTIDFKELEFVLKLLNQ